MHALLANLVQAQGSVANKMEDRLRAALETGNTALLLRLCGEIDGNLTFTAGGNEATLAHHIAFFNLGQQGLNCLKELIRRFGNVCLTAKDKSEKTVVHVAALNQNESWMKLIRRSLDTKCLEDTGQYQRNAVHFAALNSRSDSALKWVVNQLGSKCLLVPDLHGNTPIHLAAWTQGADTMEFIKRHAKSLFKDESYFFELRGGHSRTVLHLGAMNERGAGTFLWLLSKCKKDKLLLKDSDGNTPVHLAALNQNSDCCKTLKDKFGIEFCQAGSQDHTAIHFAAMNALNNSALIWFIKTLGPSCLRDKDALGATPVHLAAQYQGVDSLRTIKDCVGVTAFEPVDAEGRTVADYAEMNASDDRVLAWLVEQRLPGSSPRPPRPGNPGQAQRPADGSGKPPVVPPMPVISQVRAVPESSAPRVDASFTQWDFILEDGERQVIGEGAFGKVYKAFTDKHQTVAVKILGPVEMMDRTQLDKVIEDEMKGMEILKRIQHPNIMQFLKCERKADGQFCIFTELIAGYSLHELMMRQEKPIDELGVRKFSQQILSALNYLHCRKPAVLHRDIKCSNVMLTNEAAIKLVDFGLAKEIFSTLVAHMTFTQCGTLPYMSPELFNADGQMVYTPKTDVWAFGCTVFEMATMEPPNNSLSDHRIPIVVCTKDMPDLPEGISDGLRNFYRRCVVKDPLERADTGELMQHAFLTDDWDGVSTL